MIRGGRREEGSGWGPRVYLWWIHVDIWQNQYNILKLKKKYSCLENPINSMKRQKDRILKEELPRSVGPNMLQEISGEITPERMKGRSQSQVNVKHFKITSISLK